MAKNIAYCCSLIQLDRQDFTTSMLQTYLQYALIAKRELNLHASPTVSVYYFTPNDALTAALPPDYVFYTKVALELYGKQYTLSVNNKIPLPKIVCGTETPALLSCTSNNMPNYDYGFMYQPHYRAGNFVGEYYGMGGMNNSAGYFRIDDKNNRIVMQGVPITEYMMEYVSDGSDGMATIVPTEAVSPIVEYVHWRLKKHTSKSLPEISMYKDDYMVEFRKYKNLVTTPTIDEFIDVMYAGFQSTPKGVAI